MVNELKVIAEIIANAGDNAKMIFIFYIGKEILNSVLIFTGIMIFFYIIYKSIKTAINRDSFVEEMATRLNTRYSDNSIDFYELREKIIKKEDIKKIKDLINDIEAIALSTVLSENSRLERILEAIGKCNKEEK